MVAKVSPKKSPKKQVSNQKKVAQMNLVYQGAGYQNRIKKDMSLDTIPM